MPDICWGCKIIWLRYTVLAFTVVVSLFFGVPSVLLCIVHVKNYSKGLTTNERFAKRQRLVSVSSVSSNEDMLSDGSPTFPKAGTSKGQSCWVNCRRMCCSKDLVSQQALYQMHLDNSDLDSHTDMSDM